MVRVYSYFEWFDRVHLWKIIDAPKFDSSIVKKCKWFTPWCHTKSNWHVNMYITNSNTIWIIYPIEKTKYYHARLTVFSPFWLRAAGTVLALGGFLVMASSRILKCMRFYIIVINRIYNTKHTRNKKLPWKRGKYHLKRLIYPLCCPCFSVEVNWWRPGNDVGKSMSNIGVAVSINSYYW